jgi:hypothetical protein
VTGFVVSAPCAGMIAEGLAIVVLLLALRRSWHRSSEEAFAAAVAELERALAPERAHHPDPNVIHLDEPRSARPVSVRGVVESDESPHRARRDGNARGTGHAGLESRGARPFSGSGERR